MSYPTCLLTLQKRLFYGDLPQTTITKAINDLHKRLNACVLADGGHFEHITWTGQSRLIWHSFVKIGDNWIKICYLARIETYNRCVNKRLKILNRLWKKWKKCQVPSGGFFWLTLYTSNSCLSEKEMLKTHCTYSLTYELLIALYIMLAVI